MIFSKLELSVLNPKLDSYANIWLKKGVEALAAHKSQRNHLIAFLGQSYGITKDNYVKGYMWYTLGEHYSDRKQLSKKEKMTLIQIAKAKKLAPECVAKNIQRVLRRVVAGNQPHKTV